MVHTSDILFNDRAFVQIRCDVMGCGTNEFHPPVMCLVVGLGAFEAGQKRVVDIDSSARQIAAQVVAQNLHVTCQHYQFGLLILNDFKLPVLYL